jgi:hypothetical protein
MKESTTRGMVEMRVKKIVLPRLDHISALVRVSI